MVSSLWCWYGSSLLPRPAGHYSTTLLEPSVWRFSSVRCRVRLDNERQQSVLYCRLEKLSFSWRSKYFYFLEENIWLVDYENMGIFWSFITAGIISEYFVFIFVIWICLSKSSSSTESWWFPAGIPVRVTASEEMSLFDVASLEQWQRCQPVSVLGLDLADRAVLRVAGRRGGGEDSSALLEQFLL